MAQERRQRQFEPLGSRAGITTLTPTGSGTLYSARAGTPWRGVKATSGFPFKKPKGSDTSLNLLRPLQLSKHRDLRAALAILAERGRARMEEDGRRRAVAINPALLADRE